MSERQSKLRRLEELRRNNPHISASALSEVILDIETHGLPERHAKKHVQEARDSTVSEHTAYGPLLETTSVTCKDGTKKQMLYVFFVIATSNVWPRRCYDCFDQSYLGKIPLLCRQTLGASFTTMMRWFLVMSFQLTHPERCNVCTYPSGNLVP